VQAQRVRAAARRALARLMAERSIDAFVGPTATVTSPPLDGLRSETFGELARRVHTTYWNGLGVPVLALPMGFAADGLPVSLQLAGKPWSEAALVAYGAAYQGATDWHLRTPALGPLV
jgi:aspartyl-tRNA(Asn)/glutamyl-tRNA(Gln) amidotransferase subunit A